MSNTGIEFLITDFFLFFCSLCNALIFFANSILTESMNQNDMEYMVHPYTDVYALRGLFNFSCINFSIGYYDYHTANEYVVIEDVFNGIEIGRKMIEKLGYKLHFKKSEKFDMYSRKMVL